MRTFMLTNLQTRADLCAGLARLLDAGLPPAQGLRALQKSLPPFTLAELRRAAAMVDRGASLHAALTATALLSPRDLSALRVGERAGGVGLVLTRLGHAYQRRANRWRRLRAKSLLPLFLVTLALLVTPLPRLFSGEVEVSTYFLHALGTVLAIISACTLLAYVQRLSELRGYSAWVAVALLRLPLVERAIRIDTLEHLALLLGAGLPAHEALSEAVAAVRNGALRARYTRAVRALQTGATVADALRQASLLDAAEGFPIVSSGEQAGRLDQLLTRYVDNAHASFDTSLDSWATWIPRVAYLGALALIAGSVVMSRPG